MGIFSDIGHDISSAASTVGHDISSAANAVGQALHGGSPGCAMVIDEAGQPVPLEVFLADEEHPHNPMVDADGSPEDAHDQTR